MATCKTCGFKTIGKPEGHCVNCGYHYDFSEKYSGLNISELKAMPERISIRTGLCAICEKGETRKGYHAYVTLTNKGVEISIFEKFEYGLLMKKKWTFKQSPRFLIPYEELSIASADYDGKHVAYYCYNSQAYGSLRLNFNADGGISSKFNLNSEMKQMCERFIAAR